MKKVLFVSIVLGILLTMSNCNTSPAEEETEDPSTYTLIGTWEASGEYTSIRRSCYL